jgi:hypothetical protein
MFRLVVEWEALIGEIVKIWPRASLLCSRWIFGETGNGEFYSNIFCRHSDTVAPE